MFWKLRIWLWTLLNKTCRLLLRETVNFDFISNLKFWKCGYENWKKKWSKWKFWSWLETYLSILSAPVFMQFTTTHLVTTMPCFAGVFHYNFRFFLPNFKYKQTYACLSLYKLFTEITHIHTHSIGVRRVLIKNDIDIL